MRAVTAFSSESQSISQRLAAELSASGMLLATLPEFRGALVKGG